VGSVKTLGVDAVDMSHTSGQVGVRGMNKEMIDNGFFSRQ
jgi:hypothetical protein